MNAILDLSTSPVALSGPLALQLQHLIVFVREVNAEAGQFLNTNDITTVIDDLDISDNGIKSGEYRVGQVRRNSTMIVMQMDDKRRNIAV